MGGQFEIRGSARSGAMTGIEASPLLQLNVLLWAAWSDQPPEAPIRPVLRQAGFRVFAVEHPIRLPIANVAEFQNQSIDVAPGPVVDVVLKRISDNLAVLVECKASSFGPPSVDPPPSKGTLDRHRQARGFLASSLDPGTSVGSALGPKGEVVYLVPALHRAALATPLGSLASEVAAVSKATPIVGVVGVTIRNDGVFLESGPSAVTALESAVIPERCVAVLTADQDPVPLYLVSWIPGTDFYDEVTFRERLKRSLLLRIGARRAPVAFEVTFEEILSDASSGVFGVWKDAAGLKNDVLPHVRRMLEAIVPRSDYIVLRKDRVSVTADAQQDIDQLARQIERVRFKRPPPAAPQGTLDEALADSQGQVPEGS